ncbi:alginate lyase family protein [Rhizobium sp. 28DA2]|uniref:alginate lyase family protein n=1 Tax=Rhizobium sp. 28DA2 TaxID=3035209 RepID=UPI002B24A493|nr:alginate lyase family protein [Rhizobium sp. 28DA2]
MLRFALIAFSTSFLFSLPMLGVGNVSGSNDAIHEILTPNTSPARPPNVQVKLERSGSATISNGMKERGMSCDVATSQIETPPQKIATSSKYLSQGAIEGEGQDTSHIVVFKPIWRSILELENIETRFGAECAMRVLLQWATSRALIDATTPDAKLTRARVLAEISGLIAAWGVAGDLDRKKTITEWLNIMADDTMVFFDTKAGPRSARNNHRYWAALALATVGSLTGDHNKIEWARQSYRDRRVPGHRRRHFAARNAKGALARNYHLYAFRPLAGTFVTFRKIGQPLDDICSGSLERLAKATLNGVDDAALFEIGDHETANQAAA